MTSTNTNFTWEDEDPHAILKAISNTNDQPKVENRLHPFSCRDNACLLFYSAYVSYQVPPIQCFRGGRAANEGLDSSKSTLPIRC